MKVFVNSLNLREMESILSNELRNRHEYIWTTKQGQQISLKDMTEDHLKNALNLVQKMLEESSIVNGGIDD